MVVGKSICCIRIWAEMFSMTKFNPSNLDLYANHHPSWEQVSFFWVEAFVLSCRVYFLKISFVQGRTNFFVWVWYRWCPEPLDVWSCSSEIGVCIKGTMFLAVKSPLPDPTLEDHDLLTLYTASADWSNCSNANSEMPNVWPVHAQCNAIS